MVGVMEMRRKFENFSSQLPAYEGSRGSIVRLRIHNFMTYGDVEMKAGPNVNLVMGPNGTGKSTIVCAICLALAGKPAILGRALRLKEYIRHQCTEAFVEVELYNPEPNVPNWVVRRVIHETPTGTSSTWYLNGTKQREEVIEEHMKALNIQLDNICQFLPQDRVQDFARQTGVDLLKSTEKAIGKYMEVELAEVHEQLITTQKVISGLVAQINVKEASLRTEQQHNKRLEVEVKQFQERENLKNQIDELEGKKLWLLYLLSLNRFNQLKREAEAARIEEEKEKEKIAPLKKSVETLSNKHSTKQNHLNRLRSQTSNFLSEQQRKYRDKVDQAEQDLAELKAQLDASEEEERRRRKKYEDNKMKLQSLERDYQQFLSEETRTDQQIRQEIAQVEERTKKARFECVKIQEEITGLENEARSYQAKLEATQKKLQEFQDVLTSRKIYVRGRTPEVLKAVAYFENEENLRRFKGKIHFPMILTMKVSEQKYGKMVEKYVAYDDMISFFCEDKDDVKTMIQITKENNMRVSCVYHQMENNWRRPQSAFSKEMVKRYDFQRCLIDLIDVNDYYLSFLCKTRQVQDVYIGTAKTQSIVQQVVDETSMRQFFTHENFYVVRKSHYSNYKNITLTPLAAAVIFTDKVNSDEKETYVKQAEEFKDHIRGLKQKADEIKPEHEHLTATIIELNAAKNALQNKITQKMNYESWISQTRMIMQQNEQPDKHIATKDQVEAQTYESRSKQMKHCVDTVGKICSISKQWVELLHTKRQIAFLGRFVQTKQQQFDEANQNVTNLMNKTKNLKRDTEQAATACKTEQLAAQAKTKTNEPPSELKRLNIEDETVMNSIETDIHSLQAQLNFLPELDRRSVEEYKNRKRKIADLEQEKTKHEVELNSKKDELEQMKAVWMGPLEQLIDRVNHNFSGFFASMKCVGEVSLDKGDEEKEDFSKYGVQIKVKFRSDEPLDALSGWKQSGGERAITTALYILAIQSLTNVPFRVIDEINQGMDANNETRFFDLLCSLAKGSDTPQYFLLTPKMLPPVEYPDNVDFHIIFNGPHVHVGKLTDALARKGSKGRGRRGRRRSENEHDSDEMEVEP